MNGVLYHYLLAKGCGEPVILLHGWGSTFYMWRYMMPRRAEVDPVQFRQRLNPTETCWDTPFGNCSGVIFVARLSRLVCLGLRAAAKGAQFVAGEMPCGKISWYAKRYLPLA